MKRTLARAGAGKYRDRIAAWCFEHASTSGDISLALYDVTTLYFEAEKEDGLRKVGCSKERRVDPQIVVGLLLDRGGFPLEINCFEGNKAETTTIVPIIKQFQTRHSLADMVVVADAGMLSASNLRELEAASLRFIVGSRATKAPIDLASHFRWHGDAFENGQLIDTITPTTGRASENNQLLRAEPVWDLAQHPGSWRAVWAYSRKRAVCNSATLTAPENRARAVVAWEQAARTPRFVKTAHGARALDEASLARARQLVGLRGYVTNIPAGLMGPGEVISSYHDLWHVEQSLTDVQDRPAGQTDVPPHPRRDRGSPDDRVHRPGPLAHRAGPHRAGDPQRRPAVAPAALSDHRDQRHDPDLRPGHPRRTAGHPRRHPPRGTHALSK